jgi:hypothetical protein
MLSPLSRLFAVLALALLIAPAALAGDKAGKLDEAARVRILIVADTDAREGAACALDANNLKAVLVAGLKKQKLDGRFTIDMLTGRNVSAENVLKHYRELKVGTNESLVFYYSGHGAYHSQKGHLLTFSQGDLARSTLLAAMHKQKPQLTVVLTDCCAILDDAPATKPGGGVVVTPGGPPVRRGLEVADEPPSGAPPRPKDYKPPLKVGEAPVSEAPHPPRPANYRPPPPIEIGPNDAAIHAKGVILSTGDGPLPLQSIVEQTDGEVMRHLFYRHSGVVDINGCQRGKAAFAAVPWGGGLFTISFLSLQKDRAARFDANRNGLVEWSEFFSSMQAHCDRAGTVLTKGKIHQVPEATKLGFGLIAKK